MVAIDQNEAHWRSIKKEWPRFTIGCRATAKEFERYAPEIKFVRLALNRGMLWGFKDSADRAVFQEFQRGWKREMRLISREVPEHSLRYHGARHVSPNVDLLAD